MKELLKKIYLDGFEEDGEIYAEYFCSKNLKNAVVYPSDNSVAAGYVIERELLNGKRCAYFSAIATLKKERGKGYASGLISKMLKKAYDGEYPFAVLSPFDSNFYKRYGFFTTQRYKLSKIQGSRCVDVVDALENDVAEIDALFDLNSLRCVFDKNYFTELKQETSLYNAKLIKVIENRKTVAFCVREGNRISKLLQKGVNISEISNFNGCWVKMPSDEHGEAFIQLRIVRLENFACFLRPLTDFGFNVEIKDEILSDNSGVWSVVSDGVEIRIKRSNCAKPDFSVSIENLVALMTERGLIKPLVTQFIDEY